MAFVLRAGRPMPGRSRARTWSAVAGLAVALSSSAGAQVTMTNLSPGEPTPDPRVGLHAGLMDAGEAAWNLRVLSKTPPSEKFVGITNSDLAFTGKYAIPVVESEESDDSAPVREDD